MTDEVLLEQMRAIHSGSRETYGAPRIHAELHDEGWRIGCRRVARLMREAGLCGVSRRKWTETTQRRPDAWPAPDLVERDFSAHEPDVLYVADITYVPTWAGFLFLAFVLDACTRRILGWAMTNHLRTELVLDAPNGLTSASPRSCHPSPGSRHAVHVDRLRSALQGNWRPPGMGSVGDCYDNAMCESFFATLECELIDRTTFRTRAQAKLAIFEFIEGWYNRIVATQRWVT